MGKQVGQDGPLQHLTDRKKTNRGGVWRENTLRQGVEAHACVKTRKGKLQRWTKSRQGRQVDREERSTEMLRDKKEAQKPEEILKSPSELWKAKKNL